MENKFEIIGLKEVQDALRKYKDNVTKRKTGMRKAANLLKTQVLTNFKNQEGSQGRWVSLSRATYKRRGEGAVPLQDKGNLRKMISTSYNNDEAIVGVVDSINYGHYHEQGTIHIPKRDFLWFTSDTFLRIIEMLYKEIEKGT